METVTLDILREAIARNMPGVISLPASGMLRHHRTRFLAAHDEGFWIQAPAEDRELIAELILQSQRVGITLRVGSSKVIFASAMLQLRPQIRLNRQTSIDALLLNWPDDLKSVQRRSDFRVKVSKYSQVQCSVWRIADQHHLSDRPLAALQLRARLRNLSTGGTCLMCQISPDQPQLAPEQRLRVLLRSTGTELLLEAWVRHAQLLESGEWRVGAQFRKLERDIEGRQTLAALSLILGQLQREEIRRVRLGLPDVA